MAILNYSTTVAVDKTLGEIQGMLARHGASSILINYDQGNPTAVSFLIATAFGDRGYKLPANLEPVFRVMVQQNKDGKLQRRFVTREQAARVAWRIIKDWLEAQLAIIESEMVTLDQVLLPYMTVRQGLTLYDVMAEQRLALQEPKEGRP